MKNKKRYSVLGIPARYYVAALAIAGILLPGSAALAYDYPSEDYPYEYIDCYDYYTGEWMEDLCGPQPGDAPESLDDYSEEDYYEEEEYYEEEDYSDYEPVVPPTSEPEESPDYPPFDYPSIFPPFGGGGSGGSGGCHT